MKIGTEAVLFKNQTERIDFGGLYRNYRFCQNKAIWVDSINSKVVLFFVKGCFKQLGLCQFIS